MDAAMDKFECDQGSWCARVGSWIAFEKDIARANVRRDRRPQMPSKRIAVWTATMCFSVE
jgi:hypothetical protein